MNLLLMSAWSHAQVETVEIVRVFSSAMHTLLAPSLSPFSAEMILTMQMKPVPCHVRQADRTPVQMGSRAMPTQLVILLLVVLAINQRLIQPQDLQRCHHQDHQIYQPRFRQSNRQICLLQNHLPKRQLPNHLMSLPHPPLVILPNPLRKNQRWNQLHCLPNFQPSIPLNFQHNTQPSIPLNPLQISLRNFPLNTQQKTRQMSLARRQSYLSYLMCQKILFTAV
mmetsp:Transcript_22940/g.40928  ORF Transcript_22940/g.40928 Transcript_22940/m.40928 type:complete len:224 (-) Transcript_22940:428-1099(-)